MNAPHDALRDRMAGIGRRAREASLATAKASTQQKNAALNALADTLLAREGALLEANAQDMAAGRESGLDAALLDRLELTPARIAAMAEGVRQIAGLPDLVSGLDPARVRAGHADDVRGQRRIIALVWHGMVPDHIDHRRPGPAGIVNVCTAIEIARTEVQQRHGRRPGHTRMAVRRACRNALEQAERRLDARLMVERGDEMHFRCSGIGEARRHAMIGQSGYERLSAGHGLGWLVCHPGSL